MSANLSIRAVRSMLTRDKVDQSQLTLTEFSRGICHPGKAETSRVEVHITGPRDARRAAATALLERGLTIAPYPERDEWQR